MIVAATTNPKCYSGEVSVDLEAEAGGTVEFCHSLKADCEVEVFEPPDILSNRGISPLISYYTEQSSNIFWNGLYHLRESLQISSVRLAGTLCRAWIITRVEVETGLLFILSIHRCGILHISIFPPIFSIVKQNENGKPHWMVSYPIQWSQGLSQGFFSHPTLQWNSEKRKAISIWATLEK